MNACKGKREKLWSTLARSGSGLNKTRQETRMENCAIKEKKCHTCSA